MSLKKFILVDVANRKEYPVSNLDVAIAEDHFKETYYIPLPKDLVVQKTELEDVAEAGYLKTPEQAELIKQQGYDIGEKETLRDCRSGLYAKSEEIYNRGQVKEMIAHAIRQHEEIACASFREEIKNLKQKIEVRNG